MESKLRIGETIAGVKARSLLIEPVWNRNNTTEDSGEFIDVAFNRTSMESKPFRAKYLKFCTCTFNRTSMESKPLSSETSRVLETFNRTSMESKRASKV